MLAINLTEIGGYPIFINPLHIVYFTPFNNTQSMIFLTPIVIDEAGKYYKKGAANLMVFHVKESVDEIADLFRAYTRNS